MTVDADVIIVGSGPAGVSAAWPLVEAGVRVLMLDASGDTLPAPPTHTTTDDWRAETERWRFELGRHGPPAGEGLSPKFATPLSQATLAGFADAQGLVAENFLAVGSLAAGGLSRIWGALATPYGPDDLARWPGDTGALATSYRAVAGRIGLSGEGELCTDEASLLTPAVAAIAGRHAGRGNRDAFSLTRASNAVITRPRDDRLGCNACGLCLHGCHRGSIYHSTLELPRLRQRPSFRYLPGAHVTALSGTSGAHGVTARIGGEARTFHAPVVILAAGTLATTSIAARRLDLSGRPIMLESNPVGGAAFLVPGLIGADLPHQSFGLGQLFYTLALSGDTESAGVLYGADMLPLAAVADRLPFTRPVALRLARALAPALVLATGYLPGRYSRNRLVVEDDGEAGRIRIDGAHSPDADGLIRQSFARLGKQLRQRGAWAVLGSLQRLSPGSDAHPGCTLPIGGDGPAATSLSGELNGLPGVFIADGAALPFLSARHPTYTIMANADRIGRAIAHRFASPAAVTGRAHAG